MNTGHPGTSRRQTRLNLHACKRHVATARLHVHYTCTHVHALHIIQAWNQQETYLRQTSRLTPHHHCYSIASLPSTKQTAALNFTSIHHCTHVLHNNVISHKVTNYLPLLQSKEHQSGEKDVGLHRELEERQMDTCSTELHLHTQTLHITAPSQVILGRQIRGKFSAILITGLYPPNPPQTKHRVDRVTDNWTVG